VPLRICYGLSVEPVPTLIPTRRLKKGGWYLARAYPHFDYPWSFEQAAAYVTDSDAIRRHSFLPLLSFTQKRRRYSTRDDEPVVKAKLRELAIPGHGDGYIFAWYAQQLSIRYEALLRAEELHHCVLAYRPSIGTNISFAREAFADIASRPACLAIALDLKNFFPTISHATLKRNWAEVAGTKGLRADHFKVFRAITNYAEVSLDACYKRLGIDQAQSVPRPLCSPARFRAEIRDAGLISVNRKDHGIPQGAQISALLSNIYMLTFDRAIRAAVEVVGGSYRRYSDDLLLVLPENFDLNEAVRAVNAELASLGGSTKLNEDKTEVARFKRDAAGRLQADRDLQYLGFVFDGEQALVRSSTLSKYSRRLVYATRGAKRMAEQTGTPIFKRSIYRKFTHLGTANFVSRYCQEADDALGNGAIRRQMRRHMRRTLALLKPRGPTP